jgi:hypothetical protein
MLAVLLTTLLTAATPAPAAHAAAAPTVHARFAVSGSITRVASLRTSSLPAGTLVSMTCDGNGCTVNSARFASEGGPMNLTPILKDVRLRPSAHLVVTLVPPSGVHPRQFGWYTRRGKQPERG